jgi:hypothetical protein
MLGKTKLPEPQINAQDRKLLQSDIELESGRWLSAQQQHCDHVTWGIA